MYHEEISSLGREGLEMSLLTRSRKGRVLLRFRVVYALRVGGAEREREREFARGG